MEDGSCLSTGQLSSCCLPLYNHTHSGLQVPSLFLSLLLPLPLFLAFALTRTHTHTHPWRAVNISTAIPSSLWDTNRLTPLAAHTQTHTHYLSCVKVSSVCVTKPYTHTSTLNPYITQRPHYHHNRCNAHKCTYVQKYSCKSTIINSLSTHTHTHVTQHLEQHTHTRSHTQPSPQVG